MRRNSQEIHPIQKIINYVWFGILKDFGEIRGRIAK